VLLVSKGPTRLPKLDLGSRAQPRQQVNAAQEAPKLRRELAGQTVEVHGVVIDRCNDPSAGSPRFPQLE